LEAEIVPLAQHITFLQLLLLLDQIFDSALESLLHAGLILILFENRDIDVLVAASVPVFPPVSQLQIFGARSRLCLLADLIVTVSASPSLMAR
jgi:hypothetical protein